MMRVKAINQDLFNLQNFGWRFRKSCLYGFKRFFQDDIASYTAILTNITALLIFPLLIIFLYFIRDDLSLVKISQLTSFSIEQQVSPVLLDELTEALASLKKQINTMIFIAVPVAILLTLIIVRLIDQALNVIFKVRKKRTFINNFLLYWSFLTTCPPLMLLSCFFENYFVWLKNIDSYTFISLFFGVVPLVINTCIWSAFYIAIPNRKIKIVEGILSAFFVACCFECVHFIFSAILNNYSFDSVIYSTFCLITLGFFMIISFWACFLVGASIICSNSELPLKKVIDTSLLPPMLVAFAVLSVVAERFKRGMSTNYIDVLQKGWSFSIDEWTEAISWLESKQLVCQELGGASVLSKSLDHVSLSDVIEEFPYQLPLKKSLKLLIQKDGVPIWFSWLVNQLIELHQVRDQLIGYSLLDFYAMETHH